MIKKKFTFKLGLPHTNYQGAAEHLFMAQIGAFEWESISHSINVPLNQLRSKSGQEVYCTFVCISCSYSDNSLLRMWKLDENVAVDVTCASYKNLLIDSNVTVTGTQGKSIHIHLNNIFITPKNSNETLKISHPHNVDFDSLATLSSDDPAIRIMRNFKKSQCLGLFDIPKTTEKSLFFELPLNIERDTNGAGLVYFANYFLYLNLGIRDYLNLASLDPIPNPVKRKLVFLGNISPADSIRVRTSHVGENNWIQEIFRKSDNQRICYCETVFEPYSL